MAMRAYRARFENIRVRLSQETGRIVKNVNDQMQKEAERIQKDAIALAPFDTGALEQAIKIENLGYRRKWSVYIDRNAPADDGVTVGVYATWLHEAPEGSINWGPGTRGKPGVNGMLPGAKFLERAYRARIRGFARRMREAATKGRAGE